MQDIHQIVDDLRQNINVMNSVEFRIQQLRALANMLKTEEFRIQEALKLDLNRSRQDTFIFEIQSTLSQCRHAIQNIHEWVEPKDIQGKGIFFMGQTAQIRRKPHGVVLIVGPWNFPVQLVLNPLIGSIIGGNCTVLKFSEISHHTEKLMSELVPIYMDERVVKVVTGGIPEAGVLMKQKFDFICYTGNTDVGKLYHKSAAENFTPVLLELGGKSPVIIDESVDLELVAKRIAFGKICNAGQICIAPGKSIDRLCFG